MSESAAARLSRLLGLVPYLTQNPGVGVAAAAEAFDISTAQLIDDLELLFVSGRPGHMPDDLIDATWEGDQVFVTNADEVAVPVRLSADEARALLVALDYLQALDVAQPALSTLRAKIAAVGGTTCAPVEHDLPELDERVGRLVRQAIPAGTGLRIEYYVPSRDELTSRLITPLALRLRGGWYIDAWCHDSAGRRTFAVRNIRTIEPAPAPVPSSEALARPVVDESFTVTIVLAAQAARLVDELTPDTVEYDAAGPGTVRFELRVFSMAWLTRFLLSHGRHVLQFSPESAIRPALELARATLAGGHDASQSKTA